MTIGRFPPIVALLTGLCLLPGLSACSHTWTIADAEKCGHVRFPSPPEVVYLSGYQGFQDGSMQIVVDIPGSDLDGFLALSGLPGFTAGIPDSWVETYWKETQFADDVTTRKVADTGHIEVMNSPSDTRLIAAIGIGGARPRLYLSLMC